MSDDHIALVTTSESAREYVVQIERTATQIAAANAASATLSIEQPGATLSQKRSMSVRAVGGRGRVDTTCRQRACFSNAGCD